MPTSWRMQNLTPSTLVFARIDLLWFSCERIAWLDSKAASQNQKYMEGPPPTTIWRGWYSLHKINRQNQTI